MPDKQNLSIYAGDDYAADVIVTSSDGEPADLTGYTAQSQIRTSVSDTSPDGVAQFSCSIAGNIVTIVLTHDVTKLLTRSTYYWDLQIIDSLGWITTLLAGQVSVSKEITKLYATA